jgi:hypothetical protein
MLWEELIQSKNRPYKSSLYSLLDFGTDTSSLSSIRAQGATSYLWGFPPGSNATPKSLPPTRSKP